jgi:hypothetical protein
VVLFVYTQHALLLQPQAALTDCRAAPAGSTPLLRLQLLQLLLH